MNQSIQKWLSVVLLTLWLITLVLATAAWSFRQVFMDPENYQQVFIQHGIYGYVLPALETKLFEMGSSEGQDLAYKAWNALSKEKRLEILGLLISPEIIQIQGQAALVQILSGLEGQADPFQVWIDLKPVKQQLLEQTAKKLVEQIVLSLPVSAMQQFSQIDLSLLLGGKDLSQMNGAQLPKEFFGQAVMWVLPNFIQFGQALPDQVDLVQQLDMSDILQKVAPAYRTINMAGIWLPWLALALSFGLVGVNLPVPKNFLAWLGMGFLLGGLLTLLAGGMVWLNASGIFPSILPGPAAFFQTPVGLSIAEAFGELFYMYAAWLLKIGAVEAAAGFLIILSRYAF